MAYELDLSAESIVHNVFHVSCLKKALGHQIVPSIVLPPLDDERKVVLVLEAIIEFRERNLRRCTIREYLVKWKDLPIEDATWESEEIIAASRIEIAWGQAISRGADCNVPIFLLS